jgi:hypothetical protein
MAILMRSAKRWLFVGFLAFAAVAPSGCGVYVTLNSDRYMPAFDPAPLPSYRGRLILMRGFENADNDTTIFMYPASGPRRYGGPALASYFWYCFRSAFERLGMRVLEEGQAMAPVPVLDVRFIHIGDDGFVADVRLLGANPQLALQKRYTIQGPPVTTSDEWALEKRAYQMVTQLFWAMASDPQFQAVAAP